MRCFLLSSKTLVKCLCLFAGFWIGFISNSQAQLSGIVFKDFNNDGFQNPPHELGMKNITVSVFVGSSASPFVTQTDINGNYSFTAGQVPAGNMVRVEFTGLGANNNGKSTGQSKTNVQFLTIPSGGATDVSLGILTNNDYCKIDGTLIFTPCYVNGNALAGGSAGEDDAFVSFPYNASGVGGTTGPMPTHIAKASEVGSLWGMDYQGRGKTVLTSAIVRRHVGLGPLGTGGIYKFNTAYTAIEPLVDVKTIGIDTGPDPHTDLPADKLLSSEDAASVDAAGKVGIGGIALSGDEKTLYMVNLYDRKLYKFFVGVPAQTPSASSVKSYAIPNPCPDSDYRPWGVKEYQGSLYLGVVCTNESSQDSTTLFGTIYKFDPKTETFSIFYQFPLTYKRGQADATDACQNIRYWRPWSNDFPTACSSFFDGERGKVVGFAINPQPLISDLEFDTDGTMIIGLMDRFGLITGFRAFAPIDDGKLYDGFVSGDILRVYNNDGVYEMENNGQAGPLTGSGVGNDEGFGGGEFYGRDYWNFFGKPAHSEITNGGLMLLPGSGEILASAMDPVDEVFHAGGFQIFSNTDGSLLRSFAVYAGKKGTLGKSGGVGDMKASCGSPFIEIGNRVWNDLNKNGIQDPDEDGIDGLIVSLHDMENNGAEIAQTVTANGGTFLFNNENVTDTVKYEHHYQIRIKMLQPNLVSNELVEVSPGGSPILPDGTEDPAEMRDSDANLVKIPLALNKANLRATNEALAEDDFAVIDFQTGATTLSNHSLDIGISGCTTPTNVVASSNSPINEGQTINLTATSTDGLSYEWVGSNGFSSTSQNPSITAATLAANGIYTVTVFGNGTCTATATVEVIVNCVPPTDVTASSNSPVNEGQTINLNASSIGVNGTSPEIYSWTGPNGFTSTLQNISIPEATLADTGVYTVTVTGNGTCTATATTSVTINCVPPTDIIASSNSPLNEGQTINFAALSTGGKSYSWTGPNGFASTLQNPSIASATLAATGVYTVTITGNGTCTATATTSVTINCVPPTDIIASSNSPLNEGQTINFAALSTGGKSYSWTGPNGFASTLQNPSIASATLAATGVYTLTVTGNGTCTATATTSVSINCVPPTNITANNNSPVNVGQTINFAALSTGGNSYSWTGPNGFASTLQNPSIASATLAATGVYTLTVTGNGTCTATATTSVSINCVPPTNITANNNSPVNVGQTINFAALSTGGNSYSWAGPNGFASTLQNPSIASATLAATGVYTLTVTGNGTCTATATTSVSINCVPPTNITANNNSPVNVGQTINFAALSTGGNSYSWAGPNGFASTLQNPSIASATLAATGVYTLTVTGNGTCTATATTSVSINCVPPTNITANNNSPVNVGQTINFAALSTGGNSYSWAGPNGFASTLQNPSIASATLAATGVYTLTVTGNGTCTATATTNVVFYASMGDYAWYDFNKNGIQDNILSPFGENLGKELPAKGIVIELHKADGTLVGKDTTDANGRYNFNQIIPGSYYVKFDPASYPSVEYAVTGQNSGLNDSLDNDIEKVVYKSANFSLSSGQNDPTWDIGFFRGSKSTIGDPCTCHDILYDPDEIYEVLDEIIVESTPGGVWAIIEQTGMQKIDSLYDYDIPIGTLLIPDSNKPGRFTLRFAHDAGVGYNVKVTNGVDTLSQSNLCNIPLLFTNVPKDTVCAFESPITLSGKMLMNNVDVTDGIIKFYKVKGLENYGINENPVYTQITQFNPLDFAPGDTVDIVAEYTPNKTTQCPMKKWYRFVLAIEPECLSQIGDFVWQDVNKNGIQDSGENGFSNVAVSLLDGNGAAVTKDAYGNSLLGKTTDANGLYGFINIPPGDYMVQFGKPSSYTTTMKNAVTATNANNSDADPTTGISQKVTLASGEKNSTIDAGFYLTCVPPTNIIVNVNSPVKEGEQIKLSVTSTGGVSYLWTGPNGFSSTLQNPTIGSAAIYMAGTYTVTVESTKNCSNSASAVVIIESACRPNCVPITSKKIR